MSSVSPAVTCGQRFEACFDVPPAVTASAPGRLEVLGNHTDYNLGLTLSCAVDRRCYASVAPIHSPQIRLASTAYPEQIESYPLAEARAPKGHWASYVIGLAAALKARGHRVPGFAMLIDSQVPRSAGLSSSSAMEMAALVAMTSLLRIEVPERELAAIGQHVESTIVGANTGLLDPLSSLMGRRDHLLWIDFREMQTRRVAMATGWCFVAIDSGVKHDLTQAYNERRRSCEQAAAAMGLSSLREAHAGLLTASRQVMGEEAWRCARHVIHENQRVTEAIDALANGDIQRLGELMFASHESSRDNFRNSCDALDALVELARQDPRCHGARLSGGGFGGITIHLVREADAEQYLQDQLNAWQKSGGKLPWGRVCRIDDGARVERAGVI